MEDIPLKVLIIDADISSAQLLGSTLEHTKHSVISTGYEASVSGAQEKILQEDINTIFIDPLSIGIDNASDFIFMIRRNYPGVVFVLYIDLDQVESRRSEFFRGERRRFGHYFTLNKLTPTSAFESEVLSTIRRVQSYLRSSLTDEEIIGLQNELRKLQEGGSPGQKIALPIDILKDIQLKLEDLNKARGMQTIPKMEKSVFLSYRFAETDYVRGLTSLLEKDGFSVVTGQDTNTYISTAVLDRIRSCHFFLCLMTRSDEKNDGTFITSPWLLEEKGAALAFGKRIVLMVEEGVTEIGGLQGDWQRIHFAPKGFTVAAIKAVAQLTSYLGADA